MGNSPICRPIDFYPSPGAPVEFRTIPSPLLEYHPPPNKVRNSTELLFSRRFFYYEMISRNRKHCIHTGILKREVKNAFGRVSSASSQSFCHKNFANFTWVAFAHYLIVFLAVNGCSISAHGVSAPGNDAFLIERQTCIETSDILTHCRELKMINSLSVQKGTQVYNRGTKWRMKMA